MFVQAGDGLIQRCLIFVRSCKVSLCFGKLFVQAGNLGRGFFRLFIGCGFRGGQLFVQGSDGLIQRFLFFARCGKVSLRLGKLFIQAGCLGFGCFRLLIRGGLCVVEL